MELNQKNFDELVELMNHRLTKVESDIRWIKRFGYYISTVTTIIGASIIL